MTVPAQRTLIMSVERMEILMRTSAGPHVPELRLPTLESAMTVPAQRTLIMSVERMEILMRMSAGPHVPELTVAYPGECDDCTCPENIDYVCGEDGNTYENECWATCAGTEVAYPGECGDCTCPENLDY